MKRFYSGVKILFFYSLQIDYSRGISTVKSFFYFRLKLEADFIKKCNFWKKDKLFENFEFPEKYKKCYFSISDGPLSKIFSDGFSVVATYVIWVFDMVIIIKKRSGELKVLEIGRKKEPKIVEYEEDTEVKIRKCIQTAVNHYFHEFQNADDEYATYFFCDPAHMFGELEG